jgi:hypothetical protein
MPNTYRKKSETELEVTKQVPDNISIQTVDFLKKQETAILESMNEQLAEVREFIAQAEALGVKSNAEVAQAQAQPILDKPIK